LTFQVSEVEETRGSTTGFTKSQNPKSRKEKKSPDHICWSVVEYTLCVWYSLWGNQRVNLTQGKIWNDPKTGRSEPAEAGGVASVWYQSLILSVYFRQKELEEKE
jgi:hypothetical protein